MSDGIPEDKLLDIANRAVREADAEARGDPEGFRSPEMSMTAWGNPQLEARARALQERLDRRCGRDRAAEAADEQERVLIRYLQARDGPGAPLWERPVPARIKEDNAFRRLCRSIRNTFF